MHFIFTCITSTAKPHTAHITSLTRKRVKYGERKEGSKRSALQEYYCCLQRKKKRCSIVEQNVTSCGGSRAVDDFLVWVGGWWLFFNVMMIMPSTMMLLWVFFCRWHLFLPSTITSSAAQRCKYSQARMCSYYVNVTTILEAITLQPTYLYFSFLGKSSTSSSGREKN